MTAAPPPVSRPLTANEVALSQSVFGDAIDYGRVRILRRKWAFFQPRNVVMAPTGNIHFHPDGPHYRPDFGAASLTLQGLFVHEMTHVWQVQQGLYLPLRRHPFCRYRYRFDPDRPFSRYGIEQQAELVRHAFLRRAGAAIDAPELAALAATLPFPAIAAA